MLAVTLWKAAGGPVFKRPWCNCSALAPAGTVHYYSAVRNVLANAGSVSFGRISPNSRRDFQTTYSASKRNLEDFWLDESVDDPDALRSVLDPYPDDGLETYEVSRLVNSVTNDGPEVMARKEGSTAS